MIEEFLAYALQASYKERHWLEALARDGGAHLPTLRVTS
jgi:hypothetical protein